jgi:hypothetical protein
MLREVRDATFVRRGLLFPSYTLAAGAREVGAPLRRGRYAGLLARQADEPVVAAQEPGRVWWLYRDRVFRADDDLEAADVEALVHERDHRRRRTLQRAHAGLARDAVPQAPRREALPRAVRYEVWERDGGRCVQCGSGFDLQYDHVIPVALGGASSAENLQLLCGDCNRAKGASLG